MEEEKEITTAMQSSVAMPQSCTRWSRQLFLSTVQGGGGRGEQAAKGGGQDQNCNAVLHSNRM